MGNVWSLLFFWKEAESITSEDLPSTGLVDRLYDARVRSPIDSRRFVPLDALNKLLTEEAIKSELIRAGVTNITPHLLRYILEHAKKIFATLVTIEKVELIKRITIDGLVDADLPLGMRGRVARSYYHDSDKLRTNRQWKTFQDLRSSESGRFCDNQWLFLAPVFTGHDYKYFLHKDCPLPFVDRKTMMEEERFSHHSRVYKACIHEAHRQWVSEKYWRMHPDTLNRAKSNKGDSEGPYVAVKELHLGNPSEYNAEARTLEKLSKLDHPHLIKCLATYQQSHRYCFLFHWAERGNLRQFWAQQDDIPRNMELIQWSLLQMKGLADGLKVLHNFSLQENCLHGDLKPENILIFRNTDSSGPGRLVLSDLGSATFHEERTRSRKRGFATVGYGTIRYEPPEARKERNNPRSRRYDVWSTGCIFLEFALWLLYGWDDLKLFNQELDRYWLDKGDSARVHPNVLECIKEMTRDPRCRESALGDLLQAIQGRLLVPEHGNEFENEDIIITLPSHSDPSVPKIKLGAGGGDAIRADSIELDMIVGGIIDRMSKDPGYAFKEADWTEARGRSLTGILKQRRRSMITSELAVPDRQDSQTAEQGD